mmetsp:Transcript_15066/g.42277  ORF Transcript_15066/g.42277 Transcript_15066/m.42277 type:complete len:137 (-) Transcript_15066:377-787(-)|eukprot:CAMPEP_0117669074 /NCGR_PEP_ID=MMETSP0804-20121206/11914_1 /TAXON_ID=1074897 /ORGANISM="Tetraselmis astigmatica, Strain CCMP880" /LENGTH=136 /DNA_ID=CAMNT_0005477059 /DNA_START=208 /DNA_END=618 /DNA_ORIENTATION=+
MDLKWSNGTAPVPADSIPAADPYAGYERFSGSHDEDAGSEIRAILARGRGDSGKLHSSVFGCSPPLRTGDPVVRDAGFIASHASKCVESLFRSAAESGKTSICRVFRAEDGCGPSAVRRVEGFSVKHEEGASNLVS